MQYNQIFNSIFESKKLQYPNFSLNYMYKWEKSWVLKKTQFCQKIEDQDDHVSGNSNKKSADTIKK